MSEAIVRNLRLVAPAAGPGPVGRSRLLVHAVRTGFLVCILATLVYYQIRLRNFLNLEIWLPVYGVLFVTFLANAVYLLSPAVEGERHVYDGALFALDAVAISLLIYFTGTAQSLFLFLYLVNLILGGLVFTPEANWRLAAWTSACFSLLLIVSPEVSGQSLYFSLFVNNLAFVAVTWLSGRLTEQVRETRGQLELAQNLNDSIVDNVATGILLASRAGFVQYFNQATSATLESEALHQRKLGDVLPELGWPWASLTEDESRATERRELRRGSRVLEVTATRFRDGEGRLKGWLFLIDDRTEPKRLEEAMRQQEKLAAVGQLAAGIAHEIRNPLASISGSVQLMLSGGQARGDEETKLMKIIDKEIDRLNGLITEFLEYVRPEQAVARSGEVIDLNALVQEVLEALKFNAGLRQDVERELKLQPGATVLGRRDKLKQALLNFVINAYQAMDKVAGPRLWVTTAVEREHVVLVIRDNGCGIKPENVTRIFEPFHTTKARGTGLGLAVTHKILEAHGARVLVDSEVGVGTKFVIEFAGHRDFHTEDLIPLKARARG